MANSISLSALRKTKLSSEIATKEWTEDNFLPLSAQIRQNWYGECSTAAGTAEKEVTIDGITELQNGLQIKVKFTTNQTYNGAPTLNVNGLGAKNIKRLGSTNAARYEWLAGEIIDFVYDGNLSAWGMTDGGFATTSYYGLTKLQGSVSNANTIAATPGALTSLVNGMIAGTPYWVKNTSYAVGDRVEYTNKIYECVTANSDATWAAAHWKALDPLQIQIDNLSDAVSSIDIPEVEGKYLPLSGTTILSADLKEETENRNNISFNVLQTHGGTNGAIIFKGERGESAQSSYYPMIKLSGATSDNIYVYRPRIEFSDGTQMYSTTQFASSSHKHNAADLSGGSIDQDRISAIAISKVTDLQPKLNAISNYIPLSGEKTITGDLSVGVGKNLYKRYGNADVPVGQVIANDFTARYITDFDLSGHSGASGGNILQNYATVNHTHQISSITNLQTTLNGKLSGVKMNGSNVTVTNGVADLSTVLTAHQSLSDIYLLSGEVVEGLSNVVIPKLDTISGLVEEEVDRVDEISAKLSGYSLTGHTHTSSDITNFPPIPTVNNGTLTIQKNGQTIQTFSANQSSSVSANITVPTKTSDLTNDSGYVVSSDLTKVMEYQGAVTTYADLPNNAKKGAVYDVISAYNDNPPGTNYAWNGTTWDPLGGSIDVSNFATKTQLEDYLPLSGGTVEALTAPGIEASGESVNITADALAVTNLTAGGIEVTDNTSITADYLNAANLTAGGIEAHDESTNITASNIIATYLTAGGIQVAENTEISADALSAHSLTASGLIANEENPHGGLSTTAIDFSDGTYISSANDFALVSTLNKLSSEVTHGLSDVVNPKLSTIADLVEDEVAKLDELSSHFSDLSSKIPSVGTLNTTLTASQTVNANESLTGTVNLHKIAKTGSYNDLLNKPTIPTVNNATLTIRQNNTSVATFTANSSTAVTADISVPTKVSELSNDSGYVKKTDLQNDLSNYLPLSGGMVSSNFVLSANDENGNTYNVLSGITGRLAFGFGSSATGAGAEAIGTGAIAKGHESFAVGRGAQIQNEYNVDCVAIGYNATVNAGSSYADGGKAIQIGYGTNTTPHTMQIFDHTLMDTVTGDIPYARLSANVPTPEETDPVFNNWLSGNRISAGTGATVSANNGIGLGVGALVGSGIAIGLSSTAVAGTAIGRLAKAQTGIAIGISADSSGSNNNGVAIGYSTKTTCGITPATGGLRPLGSSIAIGYQSTALCSDSIAIGAPAAVNAISAIQIGLGTNSTTQSVQFWDWTAFKRNEDNTNLILDPARLPDEAVQKSMIANQWEEDPSDVSCSFSNVGSGFACSLQGVAVNRIAGLVRLRINIVNTASRTGATSYNVATIAFTGFTPLSNEFRYAGYTDYARTALIATNGSWQIIIKPIWAMSATQATLAFTMDLATNSFSMQ